MCGEYTNGANWEIKCQIFDGIRAFLSEDPLFRHNYGAFGYLNGNPTAVGDEKIDAYKVESMTDSGWIQLPDHPR